MDVKFLFVLNKDGNLIKRVQYKEIDDCTRIRSSKIYEKHNRASSIDFVNYVVKLFPLRIKMIRSDNGDRFQTKFHWHVNELGMRRAYIKPVSPRPNGKVERSYLTGKR